MYLSYEIKSHKTQKNTVDKRSSACHIIFCLNLKKNFDQNRYFDS